MTDEEYIEYEYSKSDHVETGMIPVKKVKKYVRNDNYIDEYKFVKMFEDGPEAVGLIHKDNFVYFVVISGDARIYCSIGNDKRIFLKFIWMNEVFMSIFWNSFVNIKMYAKIKEIITPLYNDGITLINNLSEDEFNKLKVNEGFDEYVEQLLTKDLLNKSFNKRMTSASCSTDEEELKKLQKSLSDNFNEKFGSIS